MPDSAEDNGACRICMDPKDNYVSLFSFDLSKKVMEIADVQVEKDDGLPNSICTECEQDLEKCYEFRLKVQVADKKFRENIKFPQVDIEECNIKEESYVDDGNSDNMDDKDSVSMDDEQYNDVESDVAPKITEETETAVPDPLNHVVVVEEKEKKIDVSNELLCQDDAMTEEPRVQKIEEVALDQLTCMKEEAETEIMDVDSSQPDPFGPSSSVSSGEPSKTNPILPPEVIRAAGGSGQLKEQNYRLCRQVTSDSNLPLSPLFPLATTSSVTPIGVILPGDKTSKTILSKKSPTSVIALMPGDPKFYQNLKPKVKSIRKRYVQNSNRIVSDTNSVKNTNKVTSEIIQSNESVINKTKEGSNLDSQSKSDNVTKKSRIGEVMDNTALKQTNSNELQSAETDYMQIPGSLEVLPIPVDKKVKSKNESFCWVCNVSCGSIELLQEHKERKGFICRTCTSSFDNHIALETHFVGHTPFKCKTCGEIFHFKKDLFRHRNSEKCREPLNYSCEFCNKKFLRTTQLRSHMWTHKKVKEESSEMCVVCKKRFKSSQLLMAHGKASHLVYEYLECSSCHKLLLGPSRLRSHIQTIHIEPSEDAQFPCPTCGKILTNRSALNTHIVKKHDTTQYVCEVCGQSITGKKAMHGHMKYKHSNQPFTCTKCNQQFDSKGKLSNHRKQHMQKERPSTAAFCEICGKTYKSDQILKMHLQIHSDEKPFKCETCGSAFKQKTTLRTHSRVHNSVGKYSCNECGLSFNWKQTFEKHVSNCEGISYRQNNTDSS